MTKTKTTSVKETAKQIAASTANQTIGGKRKLKCKRNRGQLVNIRVKNCAVVKVMYLEASRTHRPFYVYPFERTIQSPSSNVLARLCDLPAEDLLDLLHVDFIGDRRNSHAETIENNVAMEYTTTTGNTFNAKIFVHVNDPANPITLEDFANNIAIQLNSIIADMEHHQSDYEKVYDYRPYLTVYQPDLHNPHTGHPRDYLMDEDIMKSILTLQPANIVNASEFVEREKNTIVNFFAPMHAHDGVTRCLQLLSIVQSQIEYESDNENDND
jgi:hypothetical protein